MKRLREKGERKDRKRIKIMKMIIKKYFLFNLYFLFPSFFLVSSTPFIYLMYFLDQMFRHTQEFDFINSVCHKTENAAHEQIINPLFLRIGNCLREILFVKNIDKIKRHEL